MSSASEFILSDTTGLVYSITDEAMGFGFATIAAYDGTKCAYNGPSNPISASKPAADMSIKLKASTLLAIGALYLY